MRKLPKEFVAQYADKLPPWGPVGYVTYKRTYARLIEKTGKTEEWHEHCARLVNGLLELGAPYTEDEAFELYDILFYMKGSVSGRAHWQLGTSTVREIGADSLQNCFAGETEFITREDLTLALVRRFPSGLATGGDRVLSMSLVFSDCMRFKPHAIRTLQRLTMNGSSSTRELRPRT